MCIFIDDDGLTRAVFVITTANFQSADWALCQTTKDAVMDGIYQDLRRVTRSDCFRRSSIKSSLFPAIIDIFISFSFSSDDANSFRL